MQVARGKGGGVGHQKGRKSRSPGGGEYVARCVVGGDGNSR